LPDSSIPVPDSSRQIAFHQLLAAARKTWLMDALAEALGRIEPNRIKEEIVAYVPKDAQQILATAGIRDEHIFPTPIVLQTAPTLVGYYRLLLGLPRKSFYTTASGMNLFKTMEVRGVLGAKQATALPQYCRAMCAALAELVRQLSPTVTARDVQELPLLTLGSYFQGANNVLIGKQATADVFLSIKHIVEPNILAHQAKKIVVRNAAGRSVILSLGSDPDISVEEEISGNLRKKVAIEIKGGTDKSNAHNRAGEAEKSHVKAKNAGFRDFWTIIAKKGVDQGRLQAGSPTTNSWFDVAQVLGRQGPDWEEFFSRMVEVVGIPVRKAKRKT
jgi:hypothetical protein